MQAVGEEHLHLIAREDEQEKALIGVWQAASVMGAGWADTYRFFGDGAFRHLASQMDCAAREVSQTGTWALRKQNLVLRISERTVVEGGKLEPAIGSCGSKDQLVGGTSRIEKIAPAKEMVVPLTQVQKDADTERLTMRLGELQYWKYDDNPRRYP